MAQILLLLGIASTVKLFADGTPISEVKSPVASPSLVAANAADSSRPKSFKK